jgi:DNA-binding response OmpR family regulator
MSLLFISNHHHNHFISHVFISAQPCEENAQRVLEVGAVDYISKPFEVTDFIFRILSQAKVKTPASDLPDQNPHLDPEGFCNSTQGNQ